MKILKKARVICKSLISILFGIIRFFVKMHCRTVSAVKENNWNLYGKNTVNCHACEMMLLVGNILLWKKDYFHFRFQF